ncbi:MAG TPA: aminotransferase class IV, partial [Methylophilaceae bacterium]|nr:aminotransferase class IV [Methylophilaceae bacterium]
GITRQRILSHAGNLKLKTKIEEMQLKSLLSADEVLICNSLFGVWQVRQLADKKWAKQTLANQLREAIKQ